MNASLVPWSQRVRAEIEALRRVGSLAFVVGDRAAGRSVLDALGSVMTVSPTSITERVLVEPRPHTSSDVLERIADAPLLFDVEVLCWQPWLHVDPIKLLRMHARRMGVIALWPGRVVGRTAAFSDPGRRDYISAELRDVTLLRPVATRFPDEVPFTIERIPA